MLRSILSVATAATLLAGLGSASVEATGSADGGRLHPVLGQTEVVTTYAFAGGDDYFGDVNAVVDRFGETTASWVGRRTGINAAQRDADGHWSPPAPLGSCVEPVCSPWKPALAVDGNGTVTALWTQETTRLSLRGVYVASKPRGGRWSAPVRLTGRPCGIGSLASGRDGSLLVAFGCTGLKVTAIYRGPGVAWSKARRRVFRNAGVPQVGVSDRATAVLVIAGKRNGLRAYRFRRGSGWSAPTAIGAAGPYGIFHVAMGAGGRAAVVWAYPAHRGRVRVRIMNAQGLWHRRVTLSRPGALVDAYSYIPPEPRVTVHRQVIVLWSTRRGTIRAASRSLTGHWNTVTAYRRRAGFLLNVSSNRRGDLTVIWGHWAFPSARLYAGVFHGPAGWSSRVLIPGRWMGDLPPPDAVCSTLPDGQALVVSTTTDALPGLDPPLPGTMQVLARTITTGP